MYEELKKYLKENDYPDGNKLKATKHRNFVERLVEATAFIVTDKPELSLRCNCVLSDIIEVPSCRLCTNPVSINKVKGLKPYSRTFTEYCSTPCAAKGSYEKFVELGNVHHMKTEEGKDKLKKVHNEKYHGKHFFQTEEFKDKTKETSLEKYGIEFSQASDKAKATRLETNLRVHGVENVFQLNFIKEKIGETNLVKYGFRSAMKCPEINQKAQKTFFEKTGYYSPLQNPESKEKAERKRKEKYGDENWTRNYFDDEVLATLSDKVKIEELYKEHKTTHKVADILGVGSHRTICIAMEELGIERQKIKQFSSGELEVSEFLRKHDIECVLNDRSLLGGKEVDILVPEHMLAIEYNGLYFHSLSLKPNKKYHQEKTLQLQALGYQVIQIYEDQ